ncbi:MAG: aminomethyltransferase family protein [Atopobiaceae bacterium]|nr:aminomethyltransferase family protein [Atopobiaceae bacterium]
MSQYTLQSPTINTDGVRFWALVNPDSTVIPFEFTGWKDEVRAWQDNSYIGAAISDTIFPYDITGKGAKEFMKKYFVNNFENVTWGKSKHGMMLNPNGNIAGDGVVLPVSEEKYITTSCWPYIQYCLDREHASGNMLDVEGVFNPESFIMYQVGGPRSLEIIERATGEDVHDREYLCFRDSTIAGCPVRVLRLGMAGTLSYEVHIQSYEYCEPVYGALIAAGEKYEARRLGYHAYMMNHTENGFAQSYYHFLYDYRGLEGLEEWCTETGNDWVLGLLEPATMMGSEQDSTLCYVSPFDIDWGYLCAFKNHDFVGKEAALARKASRKRFVTLEWNADDIADIVRSQFDGSAEPYQDITDNVNDYLYFNAFAGFVPMAVDQVFSLEGKRIGSSRGRSRIEHYHTMVSLCDIDPEFAEEGTEVKVVWGTPDHPQKDVRAKVAKFPYLRLPANADFDVSTVPHGNVD